jgi:hypothetical protein
VRHARELTGVITASTLCLFRVGARDASITVDNGHRIKFKDVAFVNASAPLFVVWGAPRGAPNGDVYVFTHAGALLARLATAMLPTAPVGMAASRHGEVAFLCIPKGESHSAHIALLDLYSGYARVLEAPEALPSEGCSAAGIACAPTGVVCCADDMFVAVSAGCTRRSRVHATQYNVSVVAIAVCTELTKLGPASVKSKLGGSYKQPNEVYGLLNPASAYASNTVSTFGGDGNDVPSYPTVKRNTLVP